MTTLREAAQQALEALEYDGLLKKRQAITALRAALAQEQAEPVAWLQPRTVDGHLRPDLGYEACSSADYGAFPVYRVPPKAEPVQEPVAYIHRQGNHWEVSERFLLDDEKARGWTEEPLYTAPPRCPNCASLEAQNTELDRRLAEMEQAYENGYKAGVAAEREECAKVCDFHVARLSAIDEPRPALAVGICAAAIRARGNT